MDKCALVKPDESLLEEIRSFREAMLAEGDAVNGGGPLSRMEDPRAWLQFNRMAENPETVPAGLVPAEQFAYLREADRRIVGVIQFRRELNEFLLRFGGHIGYSVRPDERQKGYAGRMLADCLQVCRAFGLDRVLLTCRPDNEASRRTILKNGGVYENTAHSDQEGASRERYWIQL